MSSRYKNKSARFPTSELANALKLYLVTDRSWLKGLSANIETELSEVVSQAIEGGVTFLQYREKHLSYSENVIIASKLLKVAQSKQIPLIINDDVCLALDIGADGVHVGQTDLHFAKTRLMIGPHMILGVSVTSVEEALSAEAAGADYLGVGAMFATNTKLDAKPVPLIDLKAICNAVNIPVVAIGGIDGLNVPLLKSSGIAGIAVISAILSKEHPKQAASELLKIFDDLDPNHQEKEVTHP